MKRLLAAASLFALALAAPVSAPAQNQPRNLEFYWIDVEGGAATLMIAPTGESLLFDTGNPGNGDRDAKRVFAAVQKAGLNHIDHLVISHWHGDHVGGLDALSKLVRIDKFYDHGDGVEAADKMRHDSFVTLAGNKRTILKSGNTIQLGAAQVLVVKSEDTLAQTLPGGGPNPLCANAALMGPAAPENQRMVGLRLTYNNFKYMSLADLDWQKEMELVCPTNKLGAVNLYLINRHGGLDDSGAPALLGAIKPQVVIVNNGPRKGLGATDDRAQPISAPGTFTPYERNAYLRLAKLAGIEGVWQGHLSLLDKDPAHNTAPDMIANLEEGPADQGHWIHGSVSADGKFTIENGRNGFSKTYTAK